MSGRFGGKSVIVTGGGSGIGREAAILFAAEGANVLVADWVPEGALATVDDIRAAGGVAEFSRTDVSDSASVQAMVAQAVASFGRLDVAFNNAGISSPSHFIADMPEDLYDRILAVNLRGVFLCLKYEIPAILASGGGAIVNTASVGAHVGEPGLGAYCAAKHGVLGLTKNAALEYGAQGIRINAISPGATSTAMLADWIKDPKVVDMLNTKHPIGRFGQASEAARAALFLASDDASFVLGHALAVDGGMLAQ